MTIHGLLTLSIRQANRPRSDGAAAHAIGFLRSRTLGGLRSLPNNSDRNRVHSHNLRLPDGLRAQVADTLTNQRDTLMRQGTGVSEEATNFESLPGRHGFGLKHKITITGALLGLALCRTTADAVPRVP